MSSSTCIYLIIISLALLITSPPATADSPTVYEVLKSYDFPVGLLPKDVRSYELDRSTGQFSVYLNKTCRFTVNRYDLELKRKITGTISYEKIKNLNGVQVRVLFFWANIIQVTEDDDELEFSIGNASASFPVYNFYESPQCGCGFDCVNSDAGKRSGKFSLIRKGCSSSSV